MPSPNFPPFLTLGKVVVTTAGTPVDVFEGSSNPQFEIDVLGQKMRVSSILFAVVGGLTVNTGFIYIGTANMNKATGVGVIFAIPAAAAGVTNWFTLPAAGFGGGNEITIEDLLIDADTNGNSVLVTATMY
jgi:hypothetical protein